MAVNDRLVTGEIPQIDPTECVVQSRDCTVTNGYVTARSGEAAPFRCLPHLAS